MQAKDKKEKCIFLDLPMIGFGFNHKMEKNQVSIKLVKKYVF